jgi:hypothetical protein
MIAPFLATLNIALQASKSPAGGTAYVALTVRSANLLSAFLLAQRGSISSAQSVDQQLKVTILSGSQLVSRRTATL